MRHREIENVICENRGDSTDEEHPYCSGCLKNHSAKKQQAAPGTPTSGLQDGAQKSTRRESTYRSGQDSMRTTSFYGSPRRGEPDSPDRTMRHRDRERDERKSSLNFGESKFMNDIFKGVVISNQKTEIDRKLAMGLMNRLQELLGK